MLIQQIITHMEHLNDWHEQLYDLAKKKKNVLIEGQVDELTMIMNQESKILKKISAEEQQWIDAAALFLQKKGFHPGPSFSMSELIKMVTKLEEKQALLQLQTKLLATIERLKDIHAVNQQMLEHSLAFVNYSMDLLVDDPDDHVTYAKFAEGAGKRKQSLGMFDTKA